MESYSHQVDIDYNERWEFSTDPTTIHLGRASESSYYQRCFSSAIIHDFLFRQVTIKKTICVAYPLSVYLNEKLIPFDIGRDFEKMVSALYIQLQLMIKESTSIDIDSQTTFRHECMTAKVVFSKFGSIMHQLYPNSKISKEIIYNNLTYLSRLLNDISRSVLTNENQLETVLNLSTFTDTSKGLPIPIFKFSTKIKKKLKLIPRLSKKRKTQDRTKETPSAPGFVIETRDAAD